MIANLRKFSKTIAAKVLMVIVVIPFIFWGMGGVFSSGNTNSLAKINKYNISTEDLTDHFSEARLDFKRIIIGCVSGSPKRQLNSNTFGIPSLVIIIPA